MCILIDTNCLSCVFEKRNSDHANFGPVFNWIFYGKGKIVYGGTTYKQELEAANRLLKILMEFHKVNKVVVIDKAAVDKKENEIKAMVSHRNFDDPHIVAIIAVSGVKLVCTNEKRSIPFLTKTLFYTRGKKPKVYSSKSNADLLCDSNVAECCKPSSPLNKKTRNQLGFYKCNG